MDKHHATWWNAFLIKPSILDGIFSYFDKKDTPSKDRNPIWSLGKTIFVRKNHLYFNLSHSGDYALYALARNYEVEYIDQELELESIVLNLFSSNEISYWKTLRPKEQVHFF
ncbi:MAG: hypothetical protein JSR85_03465 [Proteobacteria bacterium]|nr:hypothetical protein [Pseudomonadota bacterium]